MFSYLGFFTLILSILEPIAVIVVAVIVIVGYVSIRRGMRRIEATLDEIRSQGQPPKE